MRLKAVEMVRHPQRAASGPMTWLRDPGRLVVRSNFVPIDLV
jgi:hypothetical protein